MKKQICVFFFAVVLLTVLLTFPTAAASSSGWEYTLKNGHAVITGCDGTISGEVTIPKTLDGYSVEELSGTFMNNKSITKVTVPSGVTVIGASTFFGCTQLTEVVLPDTLTTVGIQAFYNCDALKNITMPDSVTKIGNNVFYSCGALESCKLPTHLSTIGTGVFTMCSNLQKVSLPTDLKEIPKDTFRYCRSLFDLTIPNRVESIGSNAFSTCPLLDHLVIPSSVKTVAENAFASCNIDVIVFTGDAPSFSEPWISDNSDDPIQIYYPAGNSTYADAIAVNNKGVKWISYGSLSDLLYSLNHVENAPLHQGKAYELPDWMLSYKGYSYSLAGGHYIEAADGIYIQNGTALYFLSFATGEVKTMYSFPDLFSFYWVGDVLYYLDNRQIKTYDPLQNRVTAAVTLEGTETYEQLGVDAAGRFYVTYTDQDTGIVSIKLFDPKGKYLSQVSTGAKTFYCFDGFDRDTGWFYFETDYNWIYWGYDHEGIAVKTGKVAGDIISLIDVGSEATVGGITYSLDAIEYCCQEGYYTHQGNALLLNDKYLVTVSVTFGRKRILDMDTMEECKQLPLQAVEYELEYDYVDSTAVGTRTVYLPNRDSIVSYDGGKLLNEYDPATGKNIGSYQTEHYVFELLQSGDKVIAIEKENDVYYLEFIEWKSPQTLTVSTNNITLSVGEELQLQADSGQIYDEIYQWSSDDPQIANVSSQGVLIGWTAGTTVITVTTADGRHSAMITVTVNDISNAPVGSMQTAGIISNNISDNDYTVWSNVVASYLWEEDDGILYRVEGMEDGSVLVEEYGTDMKLKNSKTVAAELDCFGGYYHGADGRNYVVFGGNNSTESDRTEVLRVVQYDANWERLKDYRGFGLNTQFPFNAGSLRMTETNGKLYLYTCHSMYLSDDGNNHQANMMYVLDENSMKLLDSYYDVANFAQTGYVSHSFNQFICTDGSKVYRVDHGDGYPRAVSMSACSVDGKITDVRGICPLTICGMAGNNATGVSVGGFALSDRNCLIAGNSVDMSSPMSYNSGGQRNIYVTVTSKDMADSRIVWLTNYDGSEGIKPRTPHLVKLNNNHFLMLWEEWDTRNEELTVHAAVIDCDGTAVSPTETFYGMRLSDCKPILSDSGSVIWYVTDGRKVTFYRLDPYHMNTWPIREHEHVIVKDPAVPPTCTQTGLTEGSHCSVCGKVFEEQFLIAATGHTAVQDVSLAPTCTENGYSGGTHCFVCNEVLEEPGVIPALGHDWNRGIVSVRPTATEDGVRRFTCLRCGATKTEPIPATGDEPFPFFDCGGDRTICQSAKFTDVAPYGNWAHNGIDFCIERGLFGGMSATTFEPDTPMNRAMLVTVLWRYEGSPKNYENTFSDVNAATGSWYVDAVAWAAGNQIVTGVGNNRFDPNATVTREQMAAILFRYSEYKQISTEKRADFESFPDAVKVSSWAKTAMQWAVAEKLINGSQAGNLTYILPQNGATRAQVATILMRYIQNLAEK